MTSVYLFFSVGNWPIEIYTRISLSMEDVLIPNNIIQKIGNKFTNVVICEK